MLKDRLEESLQQDATKRRRDEEKAKLLLHQNGDKLEAPAPVAPREKHHRKGESREIREPRVRKFAERLCFKVYVVLF